MAVIKALASVPDIPLQRMQGQPEVLLRVRAGIAERLIVRLFDFTCLDGMPDLATLHSALATDRLCVQNMMQLYTYDFSEWAPISLSADGTFSIPDINPYWDDADRHPFLIRVGGELAGFVLINSVVVAAGSDFNVGEFFVARRFRRQGVGRTMAYEVFARFPGRWEVYQIGGNLAATRFWRRIIAEFTLGEYEEVDVRIGNFDCVQQRFSSPRSA